MGDHGAARGNMVHWTLFEQSTSARYAGILVLQLVHRWRCIDR